MKNKSHTIILTLLVLVITYSKPIDSAAMNSKLLEPCPNSPNCVSSLSEDQSHHVRPLTYTGSGKEALERLKETLLSLPRTTLIVQQEGYLHVEFRTKFLDFVDDVQVQLNEADNTIEIRSASRIGYWDFGANKNRVDLIRKQFSAPE